MLLRWSCCWWYSNVVYSVVEGIFLFGIEEYRGASVLCYWWCPSSFLFLIGEMKFVDDGISCIYAIDGRERGNAVEGDVMKTFCCYIAILIGGIIPLLMVYIVVWKLWWKWWRRSIQAVISVVSDCDDGRRYWRVIVVLCSMIAGRTFITVDCSGEEKWCWRYRYWKEVTLEVTMMYNVLFLMPGDYHWCRYEEMFCQ